MKAVFCLTVAPMISAAMFVTAQQFPTAAVQPSDRNTNYIDDQGTAHITRVIPLPQTVSPEAREFLIEEQNQGPGGPKAPAAPQGGGKDEGAMDMAAQWSKLLPNQLMNTQIAGVLVRIVTPDGMPDANRDRVLINLHAGGFKFDADSYVESISMAGYTKIKVVSVLYRMLPKFQFPAPVDDVVAVYKELLKSYQPQHIGIYGGSAGAILTGEVAARLKQLGLPMPAALGIFSGHGDFAREGDSRSLFELGGYGFPVPLPADRKSDPDYVGSTDPRDPVLSPIYSDLHGLPPTLFVTGERDMLLSGVANLHRAFLLAGVDARLVVWDAMPHMFWLNPKMPEAIEANHIMADFFIKELAK
jgi:acetyl esterase/lipase